MGAHIEYVIMTTEQENSCFDRPKDEDSKRNKVLAEHAIRNQVMQLLSK